MSPIRDWFPRLRWNWEVLLNRPLATRLRWKKQPVKSWVKPPECPIFTVQIPDSVDAILTLSSCSNCQLPVDKLNPLAKSLPLNCSPER